MAYGAGDVAVSKVLASSLGFDSQHQIGRERLYIEENKRRGKRNHKMQQA